MAIDEVSSNEQRLVLELGFERHSVLSTLRENQTLLSSVKAKGLRKAVIAGRVL